MTDEKEMEEIIKKIKKSNKRLKATNEVLRKDVEILKRDNENIRKAVNALIEFTQDTNPNILTAKMLQKI